jgi:PPOX class probable F420-dependent enzyme
MSEGEWREFLTEGTRTGKLATVRADGRPHVAPVWFMLDGDDILFTTGANSVKGQNLRRDHRVTMCVEDDTPPYAFVIVAGTAAVSQSLPDVRRWATAIGGRYMGQSRAEEFGRRNGVPGELLVRLTPTGVVAEHAVAD